MKKLFSRLTAVLLVAVLLTGMLPAVSALGNDAVCINPGAYFEGQYAYDLQTGTFRNDCNKRITYYYSDGYFAGNPNCYNEHLATMSMCLAMSAFAYLDGNLSEEEQYRNQSRIVQDLMRQIGCSTVYVNQFYKEKPGVDTIGVAIGCKNVTLAEQDYVLIPIAIRGAGYESEWTSNVTLGNGTGEAAGFSSAATQVFTELEGFLAANNLVDTAESGKVIFWITGYSRAGATSNLTAKRLVDQYQEYGNKVYAYCIEAPQGGVDSEECSDRDYNCIHNCINYGDLVPRVAPSAMGFKRYGVDHYVPGSAIETPGTYTTNVSYSKYDNVRVPITTRRDNEYYDVGTAGYNTQRELMLQQLKELDAKKKLNDSFSLYEMDVFPRISTERLSSNVTLGQFIDVFMDKLQESAIRSRAQYADQKVKIYQYDGEYYETVSFEDALRTIIPYAFAKPSEVMNGIMSCASNIVDKTSTIKFDGYSDKVTLYEIYCQILGEWGDLEDLSYMWYGNLLTQDKFLNFCWYQMTCEDYEKHLSMYLTAEEIEEFKPALYALVGTLLYFVDYDYNTNVRDYLGTSGNLKKQTLVMLGSIKELGSGLLENHETNINFAWLRSYDSYYAASAGSAVPAMQGDNNLCLAAFDGHSFTTTETHVEPGTTVTVSAGGDSANLRFLGWSVLKNQDQTAQTNLPDDLDRFSETGTFIMPEGKLYMRADYCAKANTVALTVNRPVYSSIPGCSGTYSETVRSHLITGTDRTPMSDASDYDYTAAVSQLTVSWSFETDGSRTGTVVFPETFFAADDLDMYVSTTDGAAFPATLTSDATGATAVFTIPCGTAKLVSVQETGLVAHINEFTEAQILEGLSSTATGELNVPGATAVLQIRGWHCAEPDSVLGWREAEYNPGVPGIYTFVGEIMETQQDNIDITEYSVTHGGPYVVAKVYLDIPMLSDFPSPSVTVPFGTSAEAAVSELPLSLTPNCEYLGGEPYESDPVPLVSGWESSDYNPTEPGIYTFTATMDKSAASGLMTGMFEYRNPDYTVTAAVTVDKPQMTGTDSCNVFVPYGTSWEDMLESLPDTVNILTTYNYTWYNVGASAIENNWYPATGVTYDPMTPGTYLIHAMVDRDALTVAYWPQYDGEAEVWCYVTVLKPWLDKPEPVELTVPVGTSEAAAAALLPATVSAVREDGLGGETENEVPFAAGEWTCEDYNPSVPGTYLFIAPIINGEALEEVCRFSDTMEVLAEVTVALPQLRHTLDLAEDISVIYAVSKADAAGLDADSLALSYTYSNYSGDTVTGMLAPVSAGSNWYFTLSGITAIEMGTEISAMLQMSVGGTEYTVEDTYSVSTYAYNQLENEAADDATKTVCANLLRYGAAAQTYKNTRTDALPDASMTDAQKVYLTDLDTVNAVSRYAALSDMENPSVTWFGKTFRMNTRVELMYVFSLKNFTGSREDLHLTVSYTDFAGETRTYDVPNSKMEVYNPANNTWSFCADCLRSADMRTVLSVAVYEGETQVSPTMQYSVESYASNKTGEILNLCKCLLAYSDACAAKFAG